MGHKKIKIEKRRERVSVGERERQNIWDEVMREGRGGRGPFSHKHDTSINICIHTKNTNNKRGVQSGRNS